MNTRKPWPNFINVLVTFLFWGLNAPIAFSVLNWLLMVLINIFKNDQPSHFQLSDLRQLTDFIPLDILVTLGVFFLMPLVTMGVAIFTKSYRHAPKLAQILFGIELPIMAFTLGRLIFLKTLTPTNIVFLSSAALSILGYILYVFCKPAKNKVLLTVHLLANQVAVVIGAYASLLMFFFLPILLAVVIQIIKSVLQDGFWGAFSYSENFWQLLTWLIGTGALLALFLALIGSPFVGFLMYWRATQRLGKLLQAQTSLQFSRLSKGLFSLVYAVTIMALAYQGSLLGFYGQMNSYKAATTFEERSQLATQILKREVFISDRLVDVYLANYRYLTDSSMLLIQQAYEDQVKLNKPAAERVQKWFTALASPFVYNGKFEEDVEKAGEYYEEIFDEPIQLAESQKVARTLASSFNFSQDQLKSSVLDREDKDVRLVKRLVTAQPDSTHQFATVTIEEEYENTTNSEQEVLYIFSLPQDSVMTDLKLGADLELGKEQLEIAQPTQPTPALAASQSTPVSTISHTIPTPIEHKNQGEVAAKGAANQTFEDQYRPRMDPAILEQVGPAQYKLRIYPVPVKEENLAEWQRTRVQEPIKNQKVRYSYVTALDSQGQAALPQITETRNVFTDGQTISVYKKTDGSNQKIAVQALKVPVKSETITECGSQPVSLTQNAHLTVYIPHSVNPWLKAENITFDCENQFAGAEQKVTNQRIAILADSSHSMGVKNWQTYLSQQLPLNQLLDTNVVDLYYFNDLVSLPISLNQQRNNPKAWTQVAFGKTDRLKALTQIAGKYDVVLMFTDGSEADSPGDKNFVPTVAQPIYLIHSNGKMPKLPDNLTYYLQANAAKVASSGTAALQNFAVRQAVSKQVQNAFVLVGESGTWVTVPVSNTLAVSALSSVATQPLSPQEPVAKVATHREIESDMHDVASNLNQLSVLDELNRTAQASGIVTPFSSFIVLTTDQQKDQLKRASLQDGRYVVNYDLGEEQLIQPTSSGLLGTSAVPEPHEWLLLLTGFGLLAYVGRHRVRAWLVLVRRDA